VLQSRLLADGMTADFELVELLRQSPGVAVSVGRSLAVVRIASGKLAYKRPQPVVFNAGKLVVNLAGRSGEAALTVRV